MGARVMALHPGKEGRQVHIACRPFFISNAPLDQFGPVGFGAVPSRYIEVTRES
jgi:hypothetical protein